jgi:hypothetical protein
MANAFIHLYRYTAKESNSGSPENRIRLLTSTLTRTLEYMKAGVPRRFAQTLAGVHSSETSANFCCDTPRRIAEVSRPLVNLSPC